MDNSYSKESIQKKLDSLPKEIQDLLYSTEVEVLVQQLGAKHKLHLDQTGMLLAEINEVLTGDTEAKNFPARVTATVQVTPEQADAIAKDVNDLLFMKIRESMKRVGEAQPVAIKKPENAPAAGTINHAPLEGGRPVPAVSVPPATTTPAAPPPTPAIPKAPVPPVMHPADHMLTQKTVTVPTPANTPVQNPAPPPPKPAGYKTDPYREPPLP